jgi:hypothetical protein
MRTDARNVAKSFYHFKLKHIVLLGACSLALGASTVSCNGSSNLSPALLPPAAASSQRGAAAIARASNLGYQAKQIGGHHQQQKHSPFALNPQDFQARQSDTSLVTPRDLSDYNPIASPTSTSAGLSVPNNQPSVYHSIIDRTDTPSRRQASSAIQTSAAATDGDLHTAAGHHHGHAYGKYYEYRAVPKKKTWKFGYKRGNHKHTISRHEHGKAGKHPHFKTKVKWHDKKSKGKGIHLWDYNHYDKKHYHHHG